MSDDLLKKLERNVDRRGFLRGSGLAVAAIVGATAFPAAARAQDQKPDEKPKEKEDKPENKEDKEPKKSGDAEPDPFKVTKKDAEGRDYRMCPQCGYNMYKQDRTWTCENCGYSYLE